MTIVRRLLFRYSDCCFVHLVVQQDLVSCNLIPRYFCVMVKCSNDCAVLTRELMSSYILTVPMLDNENRKNLDWKNSIRKVIVGWTTLYKVLLRTT